LITSSWGEEKAMGGKPSKGTPKDKRLGENKDKPGKKD
jgi:hypothetical protein